MTRVGECDAEKIGVLFVGVFYTKIENEEREGKVSACFGSPKARCMIDLFKID